MKYTALDREGLSGSRLRGLLLALGAGNLVAGWRARQRGRRWRQQGIAIAKGTYVHPRTTIGRYTRINAASHIGPCAIGAYCAIAGRLIIRSSNHFTCYLNMQDWAQENIVGSNVNVTGNREQDVEIGNAVWIGDSVIVLPDVTVGDGAIIGAGSVVTRTIPAFAVAAGNPARVIKRRFPDEIVELVSKIRWWDWSEEDIRASKKLFETDLSVIDPLVLKEMIVRTGLVHDV